MENVSIFKQAGDNFRTAKFFGLIERFPFDIHI